MKNRKIRINMSDYEEQREIRIYIRLQKDTH